MRAPGSWRSCGLRIAGLALGLSACVGEAPGPQRAWELDVPEGLLVHNYAPVEDEMRQGNAISYDVDLVLGEDSEDGFYRVGSIDVAPNGRIFVADTGDNHVRVFGSDGAPIATLGRQGQGPGEFQAPRSVLVGPSGDLHVLDGTNMRISTWTAELEHAGDLQAPPWIFQLLHGRPDGSWLAWTYGTAGDNPDPSSMRSRVAVVSAAGDLGDPLLDVDMNNQYTVKRDGLMSYYSDNPIASPAVVARPGGGFFLTRSSEYQVLAFGPDGEPEWALRAAAQPEPVPETIVDRLLTRVRDRMPDVARSELNLPEFLPALRALNVDGAGRLYVYPYVDSDVRNPPAELPVDVYSPTGERIFAGMIPNDSWSAARGDHVFVPTLDTATEEWRVERRRMIAPYIR